MTAFAWEPLLKALNRKLLDRMDEERKAEIPPEVLESEWLGSPGATEAQIAAAEARLGTRLPPSYRQFLQVSNGWRYSNWTEFQLWSAEEIDWFCARNQDWIDAWVPLSSDQPSVPDEEYFVYGPEQNCCNTREEYLQTALEISSDGGDGDIYLLIPEVINLEGEWEAWHFGSQSPDANRYRSFYELMQQALEWGEFVY